MTGYHGLDEIDPRFPIRVSQPAAIFWQLTREWGDRETVIGETIRATQQHTTGEERYVVPLPVTQPIPAITAPPLYQALTPASLARDDDITRRLRTLSDVPSPAGRRRGSNGQYLPRGQ